METTQYSKHLFHHQKARLIHPVLSFFWHLYTAKKAPASQRPWQNPIPPRYHVKPHNFQLSLSKLDCEVLQRKVSVTLRKHFTSFNAVPCTEQSYMNVQVGQLHWRDWNYGWENVVIIQYLWNNSWWVQMMKERGNQGYWQRQKEERKEGDAQICHFAGCGGQGGRGEKFKDFHPSWWIESL